MATMAPPTLPGVIVSGYPEKAYFLTGEWIEMPAGPRNAASRNRRIQQLPLYQAADGEFFYAAQYAQEVSSKKRRGKKMNAKELLEAIGIETNGISIPVALFDEIQEARAYIAASAGRPRLAEKVAAKQKWLDAAVEEFRSQGWTVNGKEV